MTQYPFSGAGRTLADNHEAEYYSDPSVGENPFSDSNGVLSITASAAAPGSNPLNLPYDSGVITTDKSFGQLYGYFEISAKLPSEAGLWPAFWMLPVNGQPATELDIFELLGINATTLHATTHSEVAGDGLSQALSVANTSTGFHTYGVDWEPSTITFYMDGKVIASAATPPDMDVPMYMLVNLAVGGTGSWPGAANAATFTPATMQIDYVRAYATAATVGTSNSSAPTIATVLPTVQAAAVAGKSSLTVSVSNYNQGAVQAGVGVALLNAAGQIIATGITGATGNYTFTGLAGGTYQVKYIPQASFALQSGSQANITTGLTAPFALATGQVLSLVHEAVLNNGYLAGSVQVLGSAQLAGISVALLNSSGATVATTTTNASGSFSFYAPPGNYSVQYLPPAGTVVGIGSHANTAGISPAVAIVALQAFTLTPETLVAGLATATGSFVVASGGTLNLPTGTSIGASDPISFSGPNGILGVQSQGTVNLSSSLGNITGYSASDTVDFEDTAVATSATYLNGVITLLNGITSVATLSVTGTAANGTLSIESDGKGGYYVGDNLGSVSQRLSGSSSQYTIATNNPSQGYLVDNQPARDGNIVPVNGSTIGFSDGIGFIDPSGNSEQITRLYLALLGRTPDQGGLTALGNLIDTKSANVLNVADLLTNSGEILARFGVLSNSAFVNQLYTNVGASPDSNATTLLHSLNTGVDRGQVALTFSNQMPAVQAALPYSGDTDESSIYRLYHTALDRAPDAGGLTAFVNQVSMTESQVVSVFATSAEFLNDYSNFSNPQLVTQLYQNTFSRAPDASGGAFWTNQLDSGASRGSVVQAFADSLESRTDTASATHDGWVMLAKS